jgi:hypothetical protein
MGRRIFVIEHKGLRALIGAIPEWTNVDVKLFPRRYKGIEYENMVLKLDTDGRLRFVGGTANKLEYIRQVCGKDRMCRPSEIQIERSVGTPLELKEIKALLVSLIGKTPHAQIKFVNEHVTWHNVRKCSGICIQRDGADVVVTVEWLACYKYQAKQILEVCQQFAIQGRNDLKKKARQCRL